MAIYGYTKNYKLIKPQFDTDTWHDYVYDNLDTIDAVLSAIFASGDWQGFWKSNTHYDVGGVVIDRATDTMYKVMVEHTTSKATFAEEFAAHPTYYELWSPNNLAEDWAIKMDGQVSNVDYSSKAYAISSGLIDDGSAKEWAVGSGTIGDTGEYSAKKHATDAHNDYISMTTDANVVAVGTNIANVNTVSANISDVNTTATNISSVNTVAGDISRVNLVADDISSVHTVAIDISNVIDVAANKTNIDTVAGISADVSATAAVATYITTVADNDTNITTVATNISDVNTAATNIAAIQAAPTAATNAATSATLAQDWATKMDGQVASTDYSSKYYAAQSAASATAAQDALEDVHGLIATPIGTIFQSIYVDESMDIARQLNGQLISSTKFTGFRDWLDTVQTAIPNLFTTEANWQAEKALSKFGQVGKFVIDDVNNTIRLPAVVNAQGLLSLSAIGTIKNESLPNITGEFRVYSNNADSNVENASGAFYFDTKTSGSNKYVNAAPATGTFQPTYVGMAASRSSSTYQDNAPVQQEAIQYPYYIQVATGVEETLPAIREYKVNNSDYFGKSMYSDVAPDNASWLASNGTYNARAVYPDYYDWLVSHIGETITANGGKVVLSTGTITDYDFVVNTSDQAFRLPLLNGEEDLPSDRKTSLAIGVPGSSEIAPANGFYCLHASNNATGLEIYVGTSTNFTLHTSTHDTTGWNGVFVKVSKSDRIEYHYSGGTPDVFQFIYAKGNGTLYYYVGDTVQDASLINAGAVLGQLANKVDIDLSNLSTIGMNTIYNTSTIVYDTVTDVTASVFAASGTGYKPSKRGVLMIKTRSTVSSSALWIYNSSGTLLLNRQFNSSEGSQDVSGGTMFFPITPDYSIRIGAQSGTAGSNYWAIFYPYKV